MLKRLLVVQIEARVTTAVYDGDALDTETGQPVVFKNLKDFQEFAAFSLPQQMAAVEATLNADRTNGVEIA